MTREEKCKLAIEKGFTYDEVTGNIYGIRGGNIIKRKSYGYIDISMFVNNKHLHLQGHQFAYYYKYGKIIDCIDHINGIRDDNRICNLREVNKQQNAFNKKDVRGYYFNKDNNKYISQIMLDGKNIYLGSYNTEQQAREVYLDAKQKYHII